MIHEIVNKFPYSLVKLENGKWEIQGQIPQEGPSGPFDRIYNYGNLKHLIGVIPENERYDSSNFPAGEVLSFKNPNLKENINKVSEIANHLFPDLPENRFLYQKELFPIFFEITKKLKKRIDKDNNLKEKNYVIFPPLKGGEFVAASILYSAKKIGWEIPLKNIANIEEKRIKMPDGKMFLGININHLPKINADTSIIYADDCLATNISTKSCLLLIAELQQIKKDKIKVKINSTAVYAVAHQKSIHELYKNYGTKIITGGLAYELDSNFYIKNPDNPENPFKVGDMGEWTKILPQNKYKNIAPWNEERFRLKNFWNNQQILFF
ncbi:hypothetical protein KKC36_01005 [Patescibacteria group bacterium]|nr:hypothetical protein [Patescibacteria group bacterium]